MKLSYAAAAGDVDVDDAMNGCDNVKMMLVSVILQP